MTAPLVVFFCLIGSLPSFAAAWSPAFRRFLPNILATTLASESNDALISPSALATLQEQGFTKGLATALGRNKLALCKQIWVVDNSGSMAQQDGRRPVHNPRTPFALRFVRCTRWAELQQTVEYHAQLAALLQSPTEFRLLNDPGRLAGPRTFTVAQRGGGGAKIEEDLAIATATIQNTQPSGVTPLIGHLRKIRQAVKAMNPSRLRANGSKVAIILATDGIPTDGDGDDFSNAVRSLKDLPVWLVIRLCTDDQAVVNYWNSLDGELELNLEVLDDFSSEAKEVYRHNPWLNYGMAIHRMRELGFHARVFDEIDERPLSKDELREFLCILLGQDQVRALPDPQVDWEAFLDGISALLVAEEANMQCWNPISKRMEPWINMSVVEKKYGS